MARIYATAAEYAAWAGVGLNGVSERQLMRASLAVDEALVGARYDVGSDQLPSDTDVREAFKNATMFHLDALIKADKVAAGETMPAIKSASILSASYTYADVPADNSLPANGGLSGDAYRVLYAAGLLPVRPCVVG